jgi:hypothetical protein
MFLSGRWFIRSFLFRGGTGPAGGHGFSADLFATRRLSARSSLLLLLLYFILIIVCFLPRGISVVTRVQLESQAGEEAASYRRRASCDLNGS